MGFCKIIRSPKTFYQQKKETYAESEDHFYQIKTLRSFLDGKQEAEALLHVRKNFLFVQSVDGDSTNFGSSCCYPLSDAFNTSVGICGNIDAHTKIKILFAEIN